MSSSRRKPRAGERDKTSEPTKVDGSDSSRPSKAGSPSTPLMTSTPAAQSSIGSRCSPCNRRAPNERKRGDAGKQTPGQWAQHPRLWFASSVDVLRGYSRRFDFFELSIRALIYVLGFYVVYLAYADSWKDKGFEMARSLLIAVSDATTGARGSTAGEAVVLGVMVWLLTVLWCRQRSKIYLVDFATYRHASMGGDPANTVGEPVVIDKFIEISKAAKHPDGSLCFNEKSIEFQEKIIRTSCISESSLFPPSIFSDEAIANPTAVERENLCMRGARQEAEAMMFKAVADLLEKTHTRPEDIDILVVNCSLFCPTPSLSAMIINHFGMRSNVISYNLGGMGCSASVISVDLAARLLGGADQKNCRALVVSTENITQNWYRGNDRSMLLSNCLFRCGAAALLLSNRRSDASSSRFRLMHIVRTHLGKDEDSYRAVFQEEDDEGHRGVRLSKQIMQIAGDALKRNITNLGPLVLPMSEQLRFFANLVARKALRGQLLPGPFRAPIKQLARGLVQLPIIASIVGFHADLVEPLASDSDGKVKAGATEDSNKLNGSSTAEKEARDRAVFAKELPPYVPNFTKAFEWICVHTGGRAVIDAIENNLSLPSHYLEPSRLSLYRYGNVSSASIWYELELVSEYGNMCGDQREGGHMPPGKKPRRLNSGDRIWQIAFGSGFKCNSAVWKCLRDH